MGLGHESGEGPQGTVADIVRSFASKSRAAGLGWVGCVPQPDLALLCLEASHVLGTSERACPPWKDTGVVLEANLLAATQGQQVRKIALVVSSQWCDTLLRLSTWPAHSATTPKAYQCQRAVADRGLAIGMALAMSAHGGKRARLTTATGWIWQELLCACG